MKRITNRALLLAFALQLGMVSLSFAQTKEKSERIIIQKKPGKSEKMVIEIDGNKVKINGKEVTDGDSNVIIREYGDKDIYLRMPKLYERMLPLANEEFRMRHGEWERLGHEYVFKHRDLEKKLEGLKLKMEKKAFLGVGTDEVEKGLKITELQKESAASAAGLEEGDIITKVDGKEMKEGKQLVEVIRGHKPGDEVAIEYLRDDKKKTTKATLKSIQMPENFNFKMDPIEIPAFPEFHFEGLHELRRLPYERYNNDVNIFYRRGPKLGATIQDTDDGKGVTVEDVDAESPAAKSGIQKGDIITQINGKAVNDVGDAREAMREATNKNVWNIQLQRGGKPVTIEVKIPKDLKKADLEP
jgi:serine protease Do